MKHPVLPIALACLPLLAVVAEAKRAMRRADNTPMGVTSPDGRLAAWPEGFLVSRKIEDKFQVVAYDAAGKNEKVVVSSAAPIEDWSVGPLGNAVAWISGGKLHLTTIASGADLELGEADGPAPTFSADGKTLAFLSHEKLVLRDVAGDRRREIAPREGRRLTGPVAITGDGKSVVTISKSLVDHEKALPDTLERADATADAPTLAPLREVKGGSIPVLAASPAGDLVAFVEDSAAAKTLRLLSYSSGKFHEFSETGEFRSVSFGPGGRELIVCAKFPRQAATSIRTQQLFKSGTAQVFYSEPLSECPQDEAFAPASAGGLTFFLKRAAAKEGPAEVIRAELK